MEMDDLSVPRPVPFENISAALLDESKPFPATYLHRFSDLESGDLAVLRRIWPKINADRRAALLIDLEEITEADTLVNFDEVGKIALDDADPRARAAGVRILWENDDPRLIPIFIRMMEQDADTIVRSTAATALGLFVYQGEMEEIPPADFDLVTRSLLRTLEGNDEAIVRRRALEALGYYGQPVIHQHIQSAYHRDDDEWRASALFAMGRSADSRWESSVLEALDDPAPAVQIEAARAAGQLEIKSAGPVLLQMMENPSELDDDLYMAAIWSLSQIGGEGTRQLLDELLDQAEDEEDITFLENAIDNLQFTDSFPIYDLLNLDLSEGEAGHIVDLDDEDFSDTDEDSKR